MVVATSNDSIFQLLLEQSDQPNAVSAELVEDLRIEWAEREALSRITNIDLTHEIMMDRWISLAERGPVPIGREAIRNERRLSNLGPDLLPMLERSFVLPGNEFLYFPITGELGGSFCELLFLATMTTTDSPDSLIPGTSGIYTEYSWTSGDVSVRITGDPALPEVRQLITNAKRWWTGKPRQVAGRPRKEIGYEAVSQYWRREAIRTRRTYATTWIPSTASRYPRSSWGDASPSGKTKGWNGLPGEKPSFVLFVRFGRTYSDIIRYHR